MGKVCCYLHFDLSNNAYPGCNKNTVGPNSADPSKRINNGIAAHICAAAPNGPRFDANMTRDERRDIRNGIWMCKDHGSLIDSDFSEYSVDTLLQWKANAEEKAAASLKEPTRSLLNHHTTYLQLGEHLIANVKWHTVNTNLWVFELISVEIGKQEQLERYILDFVSLDIHDKFAVIESQGDARKLHSVSITTEGGVPLLSLEVEDKQQPTDPNMVGSSMRLGDDGDLCLKNGIQRVSGKESALQLLSTSMGLIKGELKESPWLGSKISDYFKTYSNNLEVLSRLIKLEFVRLSLIPTKNHISAGESRSLPFVKRFNQVCVTSTELQYSRLTVNVKLEWGDDTGWEGSIKVFVLQ